MIASWVFLGTTILLLLVFAAIIVHTCRRGRSEEAERPKYRMLEDD